MTPKPDIILEKQKDVNAVSTRRHFGRLFQKYSFPLICLNLTKRNNAREETVASEYREFVIDTLNNELPRNFKVTFIHWDMKEKKRDKSKSYEIDMLEHAESMIGKTGIFSCLPLSTLPHTERVRNLHAEINTSKVEIQRGVVRTNCIDSLDRTN